jgi:hypothetical protein
MSQKASGGTALLERATQAAASAPAKQQVGEIVAGPFEVGNIGSVSVVEREQGSAKHLYAVYNPHSGRSQRIPLAAVSVLAGALD